MNNNNSNMGMLDALTILGVILQLKNYEAEIKSADNDDIMRELQRQDAEYLERIIHNQELIIQNQGLIIDRLERQALDI